MITFSHCRTGFRFIALLFLLSTPAALSQSSVEYSYLRLMDGAALSHNIGGIPNTYGLVGTNIPSGAGVSVVFSADEQRGAIDSMVTGIALQGRNIISDSTCDSYVAEGMAAIQAAYDLQTANGDFYSYVTENSDGSLTGSGGGNGCDNMRFFMAYSNHAMLLLLNNPHYTGLYQSQIITLLPGIQGSLDFFCSHGFSQTSGAGSVQTDKGVPNRDLICACANGLGNLLLSSFTGQTNWNQTNYNAGSYMTEADRWVNNYKASVYYANGRPLADGTTCIPYEGNNVNGYGYDTSYTGVGLRFLCYYALNFASDTNLFDPYPVIRQQGYFLSSRILSSDPRGLVHGTVIDDTDSTRTGPIGGVYESKTTDEDHLSGCFALLYYDAIVNAYYGTSQSTGLNAARLLTGSYTLAASPSLPAQIFNDPSTLTVTVAAGAPMNSIPIFASNAGIMGSLSSPLDPNFTITATGLPPGVSISAPYSYVQSSSTSNTSGNVNQSIGFVTLSGTPSSSGTYTAILTPQSSIVNYTAASSSTGIPSYSITGTQSGNPVSFNFQVVSLPSAVAVQNSYVRDGTNSNTNFGGETTIQVKSSSANSGLNRIGYMLFDIPSFSGTVTSASLQLYGDFGTDPSNSLPVACYGVTSNSWTENGITWNNAPSSSWVSPALDTQNIGHASVTTSWNVTSFLQSQMSSGSTEISFALLSTSTTSNGGCYFDTWENAAHPPELVINNLPAAASPNVYATPGISAWRYAWFGAAGLNPTAANGAADTANPAGDGLPNLLKYALGLSPAGNYYTGGSGVAPILAVQSFNGQNFLTLTFTGVAADVTYSVQAANNLTNAWSTVYTQSGAPGAVTIWDSQPMSASGSRFMRLLVTGT